MPHVEGAGPQAHGYVAGLGKLTRRGITHGQRLEAGVNGLLPTELRRERPAERSAASSLLQP